MEYKNPAEGRTKKLQYYRTNKTQIHKRIAERRQRLRAEVLEVYGSKCSCCNENDSTFLTVDHVFNDGPSDRGRRSNPVFYKKVLKEKGNGRYQILCMNCNWGKRKTGICPHKETRFGAASSQLS